MYSAAVARLANEITATFFALMMRRRDLRGAEQECCILIMNAAADFVRLGRIGQ